MERKNTILLTVIAIATLLVAVVGATFAYFTASSTAEGEGSEVKGTTNKVMGAKITFNNSDKILDKLDYPGGLGIFGATASIAKNDNGDTNDYDTTFDMKITYTNTTETDLDWELWVIDNKIGELDDFQDGGLEEVTTCELKKKVDGATTYFWYADADDGDEYTGEQRCDAEAIKNAVTKASGQQVASGTLKHGPSEQTVDATSVTELGDRKLDTSAGGVNSKMYYLVVKYPNKEQSQNEDFGDTINVKLGIDETSVESTLHNAGE